MASKFTVGTPNTLGKVWNSDIEIEYRKLLATYFKTLNGARELSQRAYKTIKNWRRATPTRVYEKNKDT